LPINKIWQRSPNQQRNPDESIPPNSLKSREREGHGTEQLTSVQLTEVFVGGEGGMDGLRMGGEEEEEVAEWRERAAI
jgi:hypothetical protein